MSGYFETDDIVKKYDGVIFTRLLSYLKPYRGLTALIIVALLASTVGELLIPVLQQRVIDNAILARFIAFSCEKSGGGNLSPEARNTLAEFKNAKSAIQIGSMFFVLQNQNTKMRADVEKELRESGVLETELWYAFHYAASSYPAAAAVIQDRQDLFITENGKAAIREKDLASLSMREKAAVRAGDISFIIRTVVIVLALLILVFAFTFIQIWSTTLVGQRIMKDIRLALFKKTAGQSSAFLSRHPVGRIVTRLTGDVETINQFFTDALSAFLKDFSIMIGSLITLFLLSAKLALFVIVLIPPVIAITAWARVRARDAFRRQRTASSLVTAYLSERLSGVQVVQLFAAEKKSGEDMAERNNELLQANLGEMYVYATFRPVVEWFSIATTAVVIVMGGIFILNLSLSLGVLIAFISLVSMFYNPVTDIAEKFTLLQSAMAGGERVFTLLDTDEAIPDAGTHHITKGKAGAANGVSAGTIAGVAFENVWFSYKQGEEVLKGLTFAVNPGEMVAIVGYTGAGKTTVTNLLTRLWDIDSGVILLDGVPVKDIPLDELRSRVLPVLQDVFLFSGTVADNIRLGLAMSDDEVREAACAVCADAFIRTLPDGYNTTLSEGAANISSGQRQLISFARVIAHNPSVVVLDEATSSIDTETERAIQAGMARTLAGRTSIVIAHRLSTIRHADRILVLSNGSIAEQGTHDELIKKDGVYAQLYRLQYTA
ncbi:MAG: ABC transporter ATP-binding protein/permease [Treponema sp.]|jgi:ATP-binding cassette subfamily B protein|nr:ABC transporter ATP-binding protein/permease [Treponema sp.]